MRKLCKSLRYCTRSIRLRGYYLFHHAILCGFYLREAFIKLGTEDEEIHYFKEGGVAADGRELCCQTCHCNRYQARGIRPFADVEEDEDELEENELVLEHCFLISLNCNSLLVLILPSSHKACSHVYVLLKY